MFGSATWLFGKAFRIRYLNSNNIRFHEELRVHEDSYFLSLAMAYTDKVRKITAGVTYLWRYNGKSMTRRNDGIYAYEQAVQFINAVDLSFIRISRDNPSQMPYKTVQFTMYNYFSMHTPEWMADDKKEYRDKAEMAFAQMLQKYAQYYENAPDDFIRGVYNEERAKMFSLGIETETFYDWFKRITS